MKIRIKFSKEGATKFIGHLDMVRYFQKVFRRSGIDIAYSQGFSPHQQISFASPLGLGLTSCGEYMDIMVNSTKDSKTMIDMLNKEMAEGVRVLSYRHIEDETKNSNCMSIIAAADYEVRFREGCTPQIDLETMLEQFYKQEHICVVKKTKKSEKEVDIRPLIYDLKIKGDCIFMKLATGSVNNLKPEFVVQTFMDYVGSISSDKPVLGEFDLLVHRKEMYALDDAGSLISLENLGKDVE